MGMELYQQILRATTTATGQDWFVGAPGTDWAIEVSLDVTSADFVGELFLFGGAEPNAVWQPIWSSFTPLSITPAGWLHQATPSAGTGNVRFGSAGVFPAIGNTRMLIRGAAPMRWIRPALTSTSGGGTLLARVIAWGVRRGQPWSQ